MTERPSTEPTYTLRLASGKTYGPGTAQQLAGWASEGRVPRDAVLDPEGAAGGGQTISVMAIPEIARVLNAPPTVHVGLSFNSALSDTPDDGGGITLLIPYKNKPALIGYYFGVASLIPVLGFATGIVAIILGIMGLVQRSKIPESRGLVHAIVAIILGIGGPLMWVVVVVMLASGR